VLGDFRDGLNRHLFVGGNAFIVRMLNRYRADLGVVATSSELEATAKATVRQLQEDTATLSIRARGARRDDAERRRDVGISPAISSRPVIPRGAPGFTSPCVTATAEPCSSRRGQRHRPDSGNDNDADATKYEPHYDRITSADQVQIYEPVMGDPSDVPTTGLLTATHYLEGQPVAAAGFRQGDGGQGHSASTGQRYRIPISLAAATSSTMRCPYPRAVVRSCQRGVAVSADWLPLGAQPREIRCA
jgi:hypothetical protein